ncbi:MAG: peptide-methionine (S)-S-oxide reductase MsrA [Bacteroidia bacterium]|nr:peptide-methionine (S)-S-oxide reductase MsrA [Bacteroidia bacterium]
MDQKNIDSITLGAGCFWCVEAVFQELKGVIQVESGYSNGDPKIRPSYHEVCSGNTGYVEVLKVSYDPDIISLETLLEVFWYTHDPTTLNRQGNDRGTQYRSGIYYNSEEQNAIADKSRDRIEAEKIYPDPIVTEIVPLENYFSAEQYHQEYYNQNMSNPYCTYVITPKVSKFRLRFKELMK